MVLFYFTWNTNMLRHNTQSWITPTTPTHCYCFWCISILVMFFQTVLLPSKIEVTVFINNILQGQWSWWFSDCTEHPNPYINHFLGRSTLSFSYSLHHPVLLAERATVVLLHPQRHAAVVKWVVAFSPNHWKKKNHNQHISETSVLLSKASQFFEQGCIVMIFKRSKITI